MVRKRSLHQFHQSLFYLQEQNHNWQAVIKLITSEDSHMETLSVFILKLNYFNKRKKMTNPDQEKDAAEEERELVSRLWRKKIKFLI